MTRFHPYPQRKLQKNYLGDFETQEYRISSIILYNRSMLLVVTCHCMLFLMISIIFIVKWTTKKPDLRTAKAHRVLHFVSHNVTFVVIFFQQPNVKIFRLKRMTNHIVKLIPVLGCFWLCFLVGVGGQVGQVPLPKFRSKTLWFFDREVSWDLEMTGITRLHVIKVSTLNRTIQEAWQDIHSLQDIYKFNAYICIHSKWFETDYCKNTNNHIKPI